MRVILRLIVAKLFWGFLQYVVSDRVYAKIRYWLVMGDFGNFEEPKRFTEKIQYIKFYERTKLRKQAADRIKARDYVRDKIGEQYLIPLIGNYENLTIEHWNQLPSQFVLKANHGCGMVKIIMNKSEYSFDQVSALVNKWQNTDYYNVGREWVYKDLSRNILAEKLLLKSNEDIPEDWKFFCFHGEVKIIQVDFGRFDGEQTRNLYDRNFKRIMTKLLFPPNKIDLKKPLLLDLAIEVAEKLSEDFNFIRVDLYITESNVFFGELTNYPGNGFIPFQPEEVEYEVGSMLDLDNKN